jgi:hypothetical protein
MPDLLTDAIKEAYASAPADRVALETLEISHPTAGAYYLVKNLEAITATLETSEEVTFEPCGFQLGLPEKSDQGNLEFTIAIDNVDQRIEAFIQAVKEATPASVVAVFRPYLSSDLSAPQMNPPLRMYLTDLTLDDFQVRGRATFADFVNRKAPSELYTRLRFPSLGG